MKRGFYSSALTLLCRLALGDGAKAKRAIRLTVRLFLLGLLLSGMIGAIVACSRDQVEHVSPPTVLNEGANYEPYLSDYIDAWLLAQIQAEKQMFSPSSAKFYGSATENAKYTGYEKTEDGWSYQFTVQAKVELQNAYGVTVRYTMNCQLNRRIDAKGEEHWSWSEVVFL